MNEPQKPIVSVIIAFFNEERFLHEAIESVVNQTFKNWELILVDDGSSDKSQLIAQEYVSRYPGKIRYNEHDNHSNKGVSASRNLGIYNSRGEFIAFLDADDIWLPEKLTVQVALMAANPEVGMVCEASEYWFDNWYDKSKQNVILQLGHVRDKVFTPPELMEQLYPLSDSNAPTPSGIMVKKDVATKYGGFEVGFTGKYQLYEDQVFLVKIYFNEPVYISSLCNHRYRQREDSCVWRTNNNGDYHIVRKYFMEWLQKYMDQHKIEHKNIRKLLRKALEPYHQPYLHTAKQWAYHLKKIIKLNF